LDAHVAALNIIIPTNGKVRALRLDNSVLWFPNSQPVADFFTRLCGAK
jgi:hypothetical protein